MNYGDYSNPRGGFTTNPDNRNYQSYDVGSKSFAKNINELLQFSQSVILWGKISNTKWSNQGFSDLMIFEDTIKYLNYSVKIEVSKTKNGKRAELDIEKGKIRLNKDTVNGFNIASCSQLLFMELGNLKNSIFIDDLKKKPKQLSREEFVRTIELSEWDIRIQIVNSYNSKEFESKDFDTEPCIFDTTIKDFEQYYNDPRLIGHKQDYYDIYDESK